MSYIRAHIRLNGTKESSEFVSQLNSDSSVNRYTIEDSTGKERVNARSLFGVIYALSEFSDDMYLVNETVDGEFPGFIDEYRVIA